MTIKRVTTIPASITKIEQASPEVKLRRVAGYARVSTDKDDQFSSYEAQVDYYTNYILHHEGWSLVKIYTDEGITGTSTKHRKGFNEMVRDALAGNIDLIVTKSVSRFARNTVDSLTTIRDLKDAGCECFFEKENIWTFDGKGELLLTIMSSLAQEESRSISQNVIWGMRKRAADGKTQFAYSKFLGYDKGPDGTLVVNPEQALIVRRIYGLFLKGLTCFSIAKVLMEEGIKTAGNTDIWYSSTIKSILTNEKYKGDCLVQKTYRKDFLTKQVVKNNGEVPQYYVTDDHEAIIDKETWDMVQTEMRRRGPGEKKHSSSHLFCGSIKCGDCGGWYGPKIWHPNTSYEKVVWLCNEKYKKHKEKCLTPTLTEEEIKSYFITAVNRLYSDKRTVLEKIAAIKLEVMDTAALECELEEKTVELEVTREMIDRLVNNCNSDRSGSFGNGNTGDNDGKFRVKYLSATEKFAELTERINNLKVEIADKKSRSTEIDGVLKAFAKQKNFLTEFDQSLWCLLVDYITVYDKDIVTVTFKGGIDL